ncbi:lysozyme inhibitor LprI family protein [Pseudomonas sp. 2835]|uniref:lysozyme inhibitor LprI family protein n=1 Tax=Pseudomonas sp. 2835 TaxID=3156451 RepID=UPI003D1CA1BA
MRTMVGLALVLLAFGAHAEDDEGTPCDNVDTDQQSYECAQYSRTTAERELNAAFDDLLQRIGEQYAGQPAKVGELSKRLRDAEAIWKQLRDADCKVETYDQPPGKAFDAALNTCLAQRSDDRSEYLQSLGLQNSD